MTRFRFEAVDAAGRRRTGHVEAASRSEAAARVVTGGGRLVSLAEAADREPFWQRDLLGGGGKVRAAVGKATVLARRIADAAAVIAENGPALGCDRLGEQGHAPVCADTQLVAAGDDQQPGAARCLVQRRSEGLARARDRDQAAGHVRSHSAMSAASA